MPLSIYELMVIGGAGLVTWLARVLPFILLKKFELPKLLVEYLSFVPVVMMSALWFSSLFTQHLGALPTIKLDNLLASVPALITIILSKSLIATVLVGVLALALLQLIL